VRGSPLVTSVVKKLKNCSSAAKRSCSLKFFSSYFIEAVPMFNNLVIFFMSGYWLASNGPNGGATVERRRETTPLSE
jgi:hypothetical protein